MRWLDPSPDFERARKRERERFVPLRCLHVAGTTQAASEFWSRPKLTLQTIREAAAMLKTCTPPQTKGPMSWSIHKTATRAEGLRYLKEQVKGWRTPNAPHETPNADQCDAVRDALIAAINAMPPKFNGVLIEAHGHTDATSSCNFEVKFRGLHIEGLPTAVNPAPVEVMNEAPTHPDSKEAGTNTTAPAPVVAATAAP